MLEVSAGSPDPARRLVDPDLLRVHRGGCKLVGRPWRLKDEARGAGRNARRQNLRAFAAPMTLSASGIISRAIAKPKRIG
jgi:hypothetical protein